MSTNLYGAIDLTAKFDFNVPIQEFIQEEEFDL